MSKKATPEQITEWKKQYGEIFEVEVEGYVCYLKRPGRKELSYASNVSKGSDPMKFNEAILFNCWIDGDEEIKTRDPLFLAVAKQLGDIVEIGTATIKKI